MYLWFDGKKPSNTNSVDRQRSNMISSTYTSSDVCSFHDAFCLSSRSVVDLAMSRGMDVNSETTSKEVTVSSGLIFRFVM